jgi:hypothetical protein
MTTKAAALLLDAFGRVHENVQQTVSGLDRQQLSWRADPDANSVAWLVWHLTRIQDDHVADVAGSDQVWLADGWADRFALPLDRHDTGYGHGTEEVAAVDVEPELLLGYHDATHARTVEYVRTLSDNELDRIVDSRWDPPVTLAVRLVSVVDDCMEHAGQAAFVRGLVERLV